MPSRRRGSWQTPLSRCRRAAVNSFTAASSVGHDLAAACAAIDRADRAAAIIMNHDQRHDTEALRAVLATRARYIGVLGPLMVTRDGAAVGLPRGPAAPRPRGPAAARL